MTESVLDYMTRLGRAARAASRVAARASTAQKNRALLAAADALDAARAELSAANELDLVNGRANGLEPAMLDRLALTPARIDDMIEGLRQVAGLPDPIGEIRDMRYLPSGIQVGKMRVPLGVIGIIYESRPNVTIDAASLCLKSGNATILRGGSEAIHSNQAIARCIQQGLADAGLPAELVQVVETTDRAAVGALISMPEYVDVIVPRGGKGLIERISRDAKVPVIKHLDGICHVYIDVAADIDKAIRVADNAKTQRKIQGRHLTLNSARLHMRNHQLHTLITAKLVHIQLVRQLHPAHRRVWPHFAVNAEGNAIQPHRATFALEHHFQVPFANHTLLHQLEHAMEQRLREVLAPRPGVAQGLGQVEVEFLDRQATVG